MSDVEQVLPLLHAAQNDLRLRFDDFRQALERRDGPAYRLALIDFQRAFSGWSAAQEGALLPALDRAAVDGRDSRRELTLEFVQVRELTRHVRLQIEAGAPLSDISRRLYRTKPDAQLKLFGVVLDRLESADDGRVIWSSMTEADFASTGAERAHGEGIIDLLSQAEAAEVAILFKEAGRATRVSVRTRPGGVDATVLTGRFGGGGHARAAGASVDASLADAQPRVLAEATRLVAALGH